MLRVPLLTILSASLLFLAILTGAPVELHSIEMGVTVSRGTVAVSFDPVFVVTADLHHAWGLCLGNVVVIDSDLASRDPEDARHVLLHELRHVRQFRSLGLWLYPAHFVLPIEPKAGNWSDPSAKLAEMWEPPALFPCLWHAIALTFTPGSLYIPHRHLVNHTVQLNQDTVIGADCPPDPGPDSPDEVNEPFAHIKLL